MLGIKKEKINEYDLKDGIVYILDTSADDYEIDNFDIARRIINLIKVIGKNKGFMNDVKKGKLNIEDIYDEEGK